MDFKKIGFKAGIEIHQQLFGEKLFCRCPAINSTKEPNKSCERKLRAVVGETGEVDIAAAHETAKAKKFIYVSNSEDSCQYEYDEEPPGNVNQDHLNTAIMVSKLLNAKIVDEIQVMRKIVVDGSNVSGFQRTMLIGYDGFIETDKGKVEIPAILLEEEAAQKLDSGKDYVKYKLDRLGIALLEISTDASLKDSEHVKEVAAHIGMILRSTDKVKRGLGTIRQDVNVSIKGGARTEVKGFQDLKSIPKVITKEIERQQKMIKADKKINEEVRKANADFSTTFMRPIPGAARLYPETDCLPVKVTKDMLNVELPKLRTEKTKEIKLKFKTLKDHQIKHYVENKEEFDLFKQRITKYNKLTPEFLASSSIDAIKDLKTRKKCDISKITPEDLDEFYDKTNKNKISKESFEDIMSLKCADKKIDYSKFKQADTGDVEKEIEKIVKSKPGLNAGAYMGLIMAKFKGQVDGQTAMKILKKFL